MRRLPLRWVLLGPILATIVIGFVAFAVAVDASERALRLSEIDQELARAELSPMQSVDPDPTDADSEGNATTPTPRPTSNLTTDPPVQLTLTRGGDVVAFGGAANPFSAAELAEIAALPGGTTANVDGYRVLVSALPESLVRVTALRLDGFHAAIAGLRGTLLLGGVVIATLEAAVVWTLARRIAKPITAVASGISRIADGELDTPVWAPGGSREVVTLTNDVGRMVARLRLALAEREQSTADATRARDDMRRLLADVAHEIRTPLTALKGYSELYHHGMLTEPGALDRAMARVGDESTRLHELVDSILQTARTGEAPDRVRDRVDVARVVRNVVDDLRVAFPARVIETQSDAPSIDLVGDPARIHQAVLNLGANACRHTPTGSPISIESAESADRVTIRVVDHGPGISESERDKIFLPFYRSDPARARLDGDGAGLGLAVTQQIVFEHDGRVSVSETPGGGATFAIELPLASD